MDEILLKLNEIQNELSELKDIVRTGSTDNANNFNILEKRLGDLVKIAKNEILGELKPSK